VGRPASPVGCHGHVTRHGGIAPGRLGEVMIEIGGGMQAFLARDADDGSLPPGTEVAVVDVLAGRTLLVTRLYDGPSRTEETQ
jgi:hypothetical protein